MAHLNLYVNGTPGGTDGTLIDMVNGVIDLSGGYLRGDDTRPMYLFPLFIRCDAGYKASSVRFTALNSMMLFFGQGGDIFSWDTWAQFDAPDSWSVEAMESNLKIGQANRPGTERPFIGNANVMILAGWNTYNSYTSITQNALSISYVESTV